MTEIHRYRLGENRARGGKMPMVELLADFVKKSETLAVARRGLELGSISCWEFVAFIRHLPSLAGRTLDTADRIFRTPTFQ